MRQDVHIEGNERLICNKILKLKGSTDLKKKNSKHSFRSFCLP